MINATTIIDYTYSEFRDGINTIAKSVRDSGWYPDYIVGVVRGGAVPAVYLSHNLKVPVVMVTWSASDASSDNESNAWIPEDLHEGKKILLVDDIVDGGDTIRELLEDWYLSTAGLGKLPVDNLRVAAMYYNTSQDVKVDFFHHKIDRNEEPRWIVFPWEA